MLCIRRNADTGGNTEHPLSQIIELHKDRVLFGDEEEVSHICVRRNHLLWGAVCSKNAFGHYLGTCLYHSDGLRYHETCYITQMVYYIIEHAISLRWFTISLNMLYGLLYHGTCILCYITQMVCYITQMVYNITESLRWLPRVI